MRRARWADTAGAKVLLVGFAAGPRGANLEVEGHGVYEVWDKNGGVNTVVFVILVGKGKLDVRDGLIVSVGLARRLLVVVVVNVGERGGRDAVVGNGVPVGRDGPAKKVVGDGRGTGDRREGQRGGCRRRRVRDVGRRRREGLEQRDLCHDRLLKPLYFLFIFYCPSRVYIYCAALPSMANDNPSSTSSCTPRRVPDTPRTRACSCSAASPRRSAQSVPPMAHGGGGGLPVGHSSRRRGCTGRPVP